MIKNKYIKISATALVALFVLWVVTPKVFINDLFHFNNNSVFTNSEETIESQTQETSDFDGDNKPVYFNIFKFVNNFIPVKPQN
jgi:hypothetical protein